jgi:hypothetical protein
MKEHRRDQARRVPRSYREQATRCACYFAVWQYSEGDSNFMTVLAMSVTASFAS